MIATIVLRSIMEADTALCKWAEEACPGVQATLAVPAGGADSNSSGINICLLELGLFPPVLSGAPPPMQLYLHYLVTANASNVQKVHEIINELAFSALRTNLEMEREPVPVALWQAFGTPPRPSLLLRLAIQQERDVPAAKPVQQQPVLTVVPASEVYGVLLDSDGRPLEMCPVELIPFNLTAETDEGGRFRFPLVPHQSTAVTLRIHSPLGEQILPIGDGTQLASPLELRIQNTGG